MDWLGILEAAKGLDDPAFKTLVAGALLYGVKQLSQMRKSVEALNIKIAVVVERTSNHEKRIISLERKKK